MTAPIDAPKIDPLPQDGKSRPFWSVMIPTYNAPAGYLEATLRSVLQQDPGPEEMQIEVIDDCSPQGPRTELVQRIGGGRITLHPEPVNLGLARIWNRCIERARGEWVHILHQDDIVEPGFYAALRKGTGDNRVGAVLARNAVIDSLGNRVSVSSLFRPSPGILEHWQETVTVSNPIRCPSVVVRRAVYEHLGGFLATLYFAVDWEMWQRIAAHYSFWFDPAAFAGYRMHPESETSRMTKQGLDALDELKAIQLAMAYHPPRVASKLARQARKNTAGRAYRNARLSLLSGHRQAARKQIAAAWQVAPTLRTFAKILLFILLYIKVLLLPSKPRPNPS